MKKLCVSLALLLVLGAAFAAAQPVPGKKFELGTAVSLFSYSYESDEYSNSWTLLNIPVRFGWFFWKGLQLEPEVMFTIPIGEDKGDMAYFLAGHLVYNFKASPKLVPFIGGGAGFGNGIPFLGWVEGSSDAKTWSINGLAGVKYLVGNAAAIRAEYRFMRYNYDYSSEWYDYAEKGNIHQVLIGLSIFF
jgi:opacity protein-like surface antigen